MEEKGLALNPPLIWRSMSPGASSAPAQSTSSSKLRLEPKKSGLGSITRPSFFLENCACFTVGDFNRKKHPYLNPQVLVHNLVVPEDGAVAEDGHFRHGSLSLIGFSSVFAVVFVVCAQHSVISFQFRRFFPNSATAWASMCAGPSLMFSVLSSSCRPPNCRIYE